MSLCTDIIFVRAIKSDANILARLDSHDVYNTAIAMPDAELDNAPLPYAIVTNDGMTNDQSTKDTFEGEYDTVGIGIEVAARTRKELAELVADIRKTVREFFENLPDDDAQYDLVPLDYQLSAEPVRYDPMKPCYWQIMHYQCDTKI